MHQPWTHKARSGAERPWKLPSADVGALGSITRFRIGLLLTEASYSSWYLFPNVLVGEFHEVWDGVSVDNFPYEEDEPPRNVRDLLPIVEIDARALCTG